MSSLTEAGLQDTRAQPTTSAPQPPSGNRAHWAGSGQRRHLGTSSFPPGWAREEKAASLRKPRRPCKPAQIPHSPASFLTGGLASQVLHTSKEAYIRILPFDFMNGHPEVDTYIIFSFSYSSIFFLDIVSSFNEIKFTFHKAHLFKIWVSGFHYYKVTQPWSNFRTFSSSSPRNTIFCAPYSLPLSPKPQATINLISVSMDLLILDVLYEWNYTACGAGVWLPS